MELHFFEHDLGRFTVPLEGTDKGIKRILFLAKECELIGLFENSNYDYNKENNSYYFDIYRHENYD